MNEQARFLHDLASSMDADVVRELLAIYETQIEDTKIKFLKFIDEGRRGEDVAHLSHRMKSSSRNIGAFELAKMFQDLEKNPNDLNQGHYKKMLKLFEDHQRAVREWSA